MMNDLKILVMLDNCLNDNSLITNSSNIIIKQQQTTAITPARRFQVSSLYIVHHGTSITCNVYAEFLLHNIRLESTSSTSSVQSIQTPDYLFCEWLSKFLAPKSRKKIESRSAISCADLSKTTAKHKIPVSTSSAGSQPLPFRFLSSINPPQIIPFVNFPPALCDIERYLERFMLRRRRRANLRTSKSHERLISSVNLEDPLNVLEDPLNVGHDRSLFFIANFDENSTMFYSEINDFV